MVVLAPPDVAPVIDVYKRQLYKRTWVRGRMFALAALRFDFDDVAGACHTLDLVRTAAEQSAAGWRFRIQRRVDHYVIRSVAHGFPGVFEAIRPFKSVL